MARNKIELICLDNLRMFRVREELLNNWYRVTTKTAPHLELVVKEEAGGVVWMDEDGRLLITASSAAGVAVATHPSCF